MKRILTASAGIVFALGSAMGTSTEGGSVSDSVDLSSLTFLCEIIPICR